MRIKKPDDLYSLTDVAELLGCSASGLRHHIYAGRLPGPTEVVVSRRYYTAADVERIKEFWSSRVPAGCSRFTADDVEEMRRLWDAGVLQSEIAERYDVTQTQVSLLLSGVALPGWRGGGLGYGRKRKLRRRRRNVKPRGTDGAD